MDTISEGARVRFRVIDVFLPEGAQLLSSLDHRTELVGRVVGFSDHGNDMRAFAVVELPGSKVIVPCQSLRLIDYPGTRTKT